MAAPPQAAPSSLHCLEPLHPPLTLSLPTVPRPAGPNPLKPLNAGFALGGRYASPLHGALRCPGGDIPAFGKLRCGFVAPYKAGFDSVQPYFTPNGAWAPCLGGGVGAVAAPSIVNSEATASATNNYAEAVADAMSKSFGGPAYAGGCAWLCGPRLLPLAAACRWPQSSSAAPPPRVRWPALAPPALPRRPYAEP